MTGTNMCSNFVAIFGKNGIAPPSSEGEVKVYIKCELIGVGLLDI